MASAEVNCPLQLMRSIKEETEEFRLADSPEQLNIKEEREEFPGSPEQLNIKGEEREEFPASPSQLNIKGEETEQFPGSPPQLRSVKEDSEETLRSLYSLRSVSVVLMDCCRPQGRQENNEENHRDAEPRKRCGLEETSNMASAEVNSPLQLMRSVIEETEELSLASPEQLNIEGEETEQFPGSPLQLRSVKEDNEETLRSLYSLRSVSVVLVDCCRPQGRQENNEENHRDAEPRKRSGKT
ncbi:uncharacterized protein LOC134464135 isoform X2 [Engraulis encrasicolus]|uniref:uncharacterized protein LOC134464135 isoform X2 n=1 Tax=Engraulis encrasicolus TaxID=184585 RepID=UPI002FD714D2